MQIYQGLNPFLQSLNSPINTKGFIPQSTNFPVAGDSLNPAPAPANYLPSQGGYSQDFMQSLYALQSQGAVIYNPPTSYQLNLETPRDFRPPTQFINLGTVRGFNNRTGIGVNYGYQTYLDRYGITADNLTFVFSQGTTVFNVTTTSNPGTVVASSGFNRIGDYYNQAELSFWGKYTAFDTEGSAAMVAFYDPSEAAGTEPYFQAPLTGNWAGVSSEFQHITMSYTTQNLSTSGAAGTSTFNVAVRIPSGGAGTAIVKNIKINVTTLNHNFNGI